MIKKFIDKLLGKTGSRAGKPRFGKREEIAVDVHGIDPKLVDERALNVVRTLKQGGYEAYIVGGAVRDLLVGLRPKDFDVATNATPEQVKALFRRAFIIGRRFRIVHVVFGRGREHEVIEVSTFRAYLDNIAAEQVAGNEKTSRNDLAGMKHAVDSTGRVLRDNVWGPQEEDAVRRDFTINAMYYDPESQIVVDYHKGLQDTKKRTLRMIGDAAARYREDPVRIIRAVRFAAKLSALGFTLDAKTAKPLADSLVLLADVPQSRLFDEMLKLLQTGHAVASIEQLRKLGLARGIYPLLDLVVERADSPFVNAALQDTDRRVGEEKPVAPSFLLACVLWADVRDGWARRVAQREHSHPALQDAIDEVFNARIGDVSGRGKLGGDMREMRLRAETGEVDVVLADWWQEFSVADDATREDLVYQVKAEQQRHARAPRVHRATATGGGSSVGVDFAAAEERAHAPVKNGSAPSGEGFSAAEEGDTGAPRKRRRRRRKPTGGGESGEGSAAATE